MFFSIVRDPSGNDFVNPCIVNMNFRVIASKRSARPCCSPLDGAAGAPLLTNFLSFFPERLVRVRRVGGVLDKRNALWQSTIIHRSTPKIPVIVLFIVVTVFTLTICWWMSTANIIRWFRFNSGIPGYPTVRDYIWDEGCLLLKWRTPQRRRRLQPATWWCKQNIKIVSILHFPTEFCRRHSHQKGVKKNTPKNQKRGHTQKTHDIRSPLINLFPFAARWRFLIATFLFQTRIQRMSLCPPWIQIPLVRGVKRCFNYIILVDNCDARRFPVGVLLKRVQKLHYLLHGLNCNCAGERA